MKILFFAALAMILFYFIKKAYKNTNYPKAYHLVKMGKLARMNRIKGSHLQDGKPFYISEGLGQTGVNIRVGSRPEITLHELSLATAENEAVAAI